MLYINDIMPLVFASQYYSEGRSQLTELQFRESLTTYSGATVRPICLWRIINDVRRLHFISFPPILRISNQVTKDSQVIKRECLAQRFLLYSLGEILSQLLISCGLLSLPYKCIKTHQQCWIINPCHLSKSDEWLDASKFRGDFVMHTCDTYI